MNLGSDGTIVTKEVFIAMGDPGDAFVLIPAEIGFAIRGGSYLTNGSISHSKRPDELALTYSHDTQHFALGNHLPSAV